VLANHGVISVQKVGQAAAAGTAGSYLQGHFAYPAAAQGGMVAAPPNGMMPVYPFYHYQYHHASQGLGVPAAHFFPTVSAAAVTTVPAIVSKPTVMAAAPPKGKHITPPKCIQTHRSNNTSSHVQPTRHHPCRAKSFACARSVPWQAFWPCQAGMAGTRN